MTRFTAPTRWASLPPAGGYDRGRGARVVARARVFLDEAFPIAGTSHADARRYHVEKGQLLADDKPLMEPEKFVGYTRPSRGAGRGASAQQRAACGTGVRPHPPHRRARSGASGRCADGGAVSAIMDCEDSVACVDAEDKVLAYGNWLGLMQGDLAESFEKGGKTV
jgi:malate synthase